MKQKLSLVEPTPNTVTVLNDTNDKVSEIELLRMYRELTLEKKQLQERLNTVENNISKILEQLVPETIEKMNDGQIKK